MSASNWMQRASGLILPKAELDLACKFRFGVTDEDSSCCYYEPCTTCEPYSMEVTFSGFVNDIPPTAGCVDCEDFNGTFVCTWYPPWYWEGLNCFWRYFFESPICGYYGITVLLKTNILLKWKVTIDDYVANAIWSHEDYQTFYPKCETIDDDLTLFWPDYPSADMPCDLSSVVCHVKSVLA